MIPKIIHYCWFGRTEMPATIQAFISSWHTHMPEPEWTYKLWNEDNFDVQSHPYTREAYEAGKYAFVSDYVRLHALYHEGGLYFDTDVEVFKSFDDLLGYKAFGGFEGSKFSPLLTAVLATEPGGVWIREQLEAYKDRHFLRSDGTMDLTTNVEFISERMCQRGFLQDGKEQDYADMHIFPVTYFCPHQTTGEYRRTQDTYCDHKCYGSWMTRPGKVSPLWKFIGKWHLYPLVTLKRKIFK